MVYKLLETFSACMSGEMEELKREKVKKKKKEGGGGEGEWN